MVELTILATYVFDGETLHVATYSPSTPRQRRAGRPGWQTVQPGLGGCWNHVSGWQVQRCAHPTANWPYIAAGPGDRSLVAPSGRGFRKLIDAMLAVEQLVAAEKELTK